MYATTTLTLVLLGSSKIALMHPMLHYFSLLYASHPWAASSHINITPAVIIFAPFPICALFTPGVSHACSPSPSVTYLAAADVSSCFVSCSPV